MIKLHAGYISGTDHHGTLECLCYQPAQATADIHCQRPAKQEIHQNEREPEKVLSALAQIVDRQVQKAQLFGESHEQKCEYLTLEIPHSPTQEILVYGCAGSVGARYSMRAALLLSILREVSTLLQRPIGADEQSHFDRVLREANVLIRNFSCDSKTRHMQHTFRSMIKSLQRLEVQMRPHAYSSSRHNKDD
ncbi:hypothetical protein CI789_06715 [Erwinia persicina]|nr:hypothetical protein CI789_06715 [Erwinia persicina]